MAEPPPIDDILWADDDERIRAGGPSAGVGPEGRLPDLDGIAGAEEVADIAPPPPPAGQAPAGQAGPGPQPGAGAQGAGAEAPTAEASGDGGEASDISVEDLVQDLERVTAERDQYLDTSRRLQADFENYRKAVAKREADARERANESLVSEILPVLDACDGAVANGADDVEPVRSALVDALTKQGLDRIDGQDEAFDPELHDAVMHEPSEDGTGPVVAEVMRAGYRWRGRVVRPAMVRVRG